MRHIVPAAVVLATSLTVAVPAIAAVPIVQPFEQAAFDAAQKAGRPILVWVHAPWCPVCREQAKTIARLTAQAPFSKMVVFRIDYDTQKSLWQKFGASMQSTLIAYQGKRETARIAHDADAARVATVIRSAIG